jgi:CubicO group peptidase (beta-lactamase class C family)
MKRLLYLLLFASTTVIAQTTLPQSTPEKEGVSSAGIADFLEAVSKSRNELHGFVFVRHGKVIAKAFSRPYADSLKHTMYSTSKSFTSTAIGFAVAEKKLHVTDKVISFFPDMLPDTVSNFLQQLTVQNLLTMSVGHAQDPSGPIGSKPGWVKSFLATTIVDTPGKKFLYNSMATFMLSAIIQKVTGEKVIDYLEPRLFQPLAITNKDWETNPEGINVGGWGLRIRTMDMAKLGQLYLQKGKWNGRQLIPALWVEEASKAHIIQNPAATAEQRQNSDWLQGYGYQFWRSRHNSFRADGAFGQYILIFPELDAVIAITSETPDMQDELNLVWKHLYPAIKTAALPRNSGAAAAVNVAASRLAIRPFKAASDTSGDINPIVKWTKKTFSLNKNGQGFETMNINISDTVVKLDIRGAAETYNIEFGKRDWIYATMDLKGPALTERMANSMAGLPPVKVSGRFRWKDAQTLELALQYIESPHREIWTCYFTNNGFKMEIRNSIATMKEDAIEETIVSAN